MNDTAASRRAATTTISPMEHEYEYKSGLPCVASTTMTPKLEEGRKRNPSGNWGSVSTEKKGAVFIISCGLVFRDGETTKTLHHA